MSENSMILIAEQLSNDFLSYISLFVKDHINIKCNTSRTHLQSPVVFYINNTCLCVVLCFCFIPKTGMLLFLKNENKTEILKKQ